MPVYDQTVVGASGPALGDVVSYLARFGFILILLYGSLRALKTFTLRQQGAAASARIEVLETRYLSSNRALYLVSIGSRKWLLGGTDQQITLLAELENGEREMAYGTKEVEDGPSRMEDRG
jgi:flagellar biogenesis protein FliO